MSAGRTIFRVLGIAAAGLLAVTAPMAAATWWLDAAPRTERHAAASPSQSESVPTRGMTMRQVESRFGAPAARRAPVGDPPITRWEYGEFIVYFEYRHVIHTVRKRDPS